ncbi:MAG: 2-C-methyl-D-erythritol 4-phosphate cytidylyltransferase [Lachnospiraceae bacterium]|nr:2-C-methyl-D-erythritol 4-phosphate cytidylyltransferase [Lachnospiraceae bacterium]
MKYIIMADGKGTRWDNYNHIPKHFIKIGNETLLERTVRLLKEREPSSTVYITSHDPRYEVKGAIRYEPLHNVLEIDRFTEELIADDVCFLYGDTYYSEEAMDRITGEKVKDLMFFGNEKSIVAIKVKDGALFKQHVDRVRTLFLHHLISSCKGWQVYQSFAGLPYTHKEIGEHYIYLKDETRDFNSPSDLK